LSETLQLAVGDLVIGSLQGGHVHWRTSSRFPLQTLVAGVAGYRSSDELTRAIIDFHFEGTMSETLNGPEFLFAKALDIVREILPGKTDEQKENSLPADLRETLTHSLHWLFEVANTRRDTRHPITKRPLSLHPAMTGAEKLAYLRNTDAVLRGVVCHRLSIPYVDVRY
jgi:hypothetical protein